MPGKACNPIAFGLMLIKFLNVFTSVPQTWLIDSAFNAVCMMEGEIRPVLWGGALTDEGS